MVQDLETGKAVFREDMLKVDFGKGPEPVSISEVTVKRHGRPKALEGIGGRKAREFGLTEQAEMERFAREGGFAEIPEGLHANPVFNPRFWQTADAAIRPFTQKIDSAIGRAVGRLPFSIRRWLREDPATKRIIQETRREVGERQSETEAVLRMVLRENPTPAELALADRIARGVIPQDRLALFTEFNIPILRSSNPLEGPSLPDEDEGGQIRRTLQLFSGGTQLCVRGVLTACDAGYISLGEHVITMCADTSLIVKGAPTAKFFSAFIVREFVCKPLVLDISHGEILPAELDIDAMAKEIRTVDQTPQKLLETPDKEEKT